MTKNVETVSFATKTSKILKLMINSVYTNKEVFLRELVSNSVDAIEKRKYAVVAEDPSLAPKDGNYEVVIILDEKAKTITVKDNGIGMTREEMIENLGTIAKSGTEEFVEKVGKNNSLIGQFGIGFYSAFIISDKVTVTSKKAGSQEGYTWESDGQEQYSIAKCFDPCTEGTQVTLHVREGEEEYLDKFRLKHILETYSSGTDVPISIEIGSEVEKIKTTNAIWNMDRDKITEDEYQNFYKSLAHLPDSPALKIHYKVEGLIEFRVLLFIPSMKPFNLFDPDRATRVKLYAKRIFITDSNLDIIPKYMRFIYGVVESNDVPLNINRESLQGNAVVRKMSSLIVKRIFTELEHMKQDTFDKYLEFWGNFGSVMKEGLCEAISNKDELLQCCLFYTNKSQQVPRSLAEYIADAKQSEKEIYYCVGDSVENIMMSPQMETFNKHDIEVLLLTDSVDGFWTNVVNRYEDFTFKSITRSDVNINKVAEEDEKIQDVNRDEMVTLFTKALDGKVREVKISNKLTDSPACITVAGGGMDISMERFLIEQQQLKQGSLKVLELNPLNSLVCFATEKLKNSDTYEYGVDIATTIFEIACIAQGEIVKNPPQFAQRVSKLLKEIVEDQ